MSIIASKTFYSGKENPNTPFVHCPAIILRVLILIVVEKESDYYLNQEVSDYTRGVLILIVVEERIKSKTNPT